MSSHAKAAKKFIADRERTAWHDQALYFVREKRDRMAQGVPEWEALREMASQTKKHTISHLDYYLEMFERNATANGVQVHWAKDAEEHNRIVYEIIQKHGGKHLVKSKSMLAEECGLSPYLEARGIEAVETDLGERIMQFMGTPPSHIVLPAIHVKREEVGKVFEEKIQTEPGNSGPTYLTHAARKALRQNFLHADIAMTGVNFAVASSGAFVVCTNEGNADMGTSFPKVHIAIMGMEKVIPDYDALALYVRLLARSATGQPSTTYTSHYKKPVEGQEMHIVIVDNGRSDILANADHVNMLKCLRCGSCINTCPVCLRLYALPLLFQCVPRQDRLGGTNLQMAAGLGRHAPGCVGEEVYRQRLEGGAGASGLVLCGGEGRQGGGENAAFCIVQFFGRLGQGTGIAGICQGDV